MKKIMAISTYPIKNPQHGGQKRLAAIVDAYKSFADVKHMAVFNRANYRDYTAWDVPLSREAQKEANKHPLTSDIICGKMVDRDMKVKALVNKRLLQFQPDIIHIEQPFVYIGLKPLLKELGMRPRIIFSSQNVEGPMKRDILEGYDTNSKYIDEVVEVIDRVETELARDADLTLACTEEDIVVHKSQGARRIVLAMNGIAPLQTTVQAKEAWRKELARGDVDRTVLFVASAHPPSIVGFDKVVGKGLGFLRRNERLVIAGGIGDYYKDMIKPTNQDIADATFWLRAISRGRVGETDLGAFLSKADVILLPITEGGGSNLKTAEAIAANKKVVTTTHALRSFEWAASLPNVWVADAKADFVRAIRQALDATFIERDRKQRQLADTVLWSHRLEKMVKEVKKL